MQLGWTVTRFTDDDVEQDAKAVGRAIAKKRRRQTSVFPPQAPNSGESGYQNPHRRCQRGQQTLTQWPFASEVGLSTVGGLLLASMTWRQSHQADRHDEERRNQDEHQQNVIHGGDWLLRNTDEQ
jgi:hypothetical protein